jgi:hypothetical protein
MLGRAKGVTLARIEHSATIPRENLMDSYSD